MLNQPTEDMVLFLELFTKELIINSRTKEVQEPIKERAAFNKVRKEEKITPLIASEFSMQEETIQNLSHYKNPTAEAEIKPAGLPKITVPKEFIAAAQPRVLKTKIMPSRKITAPQSAFPAVRRITPKVQIKRNFTTPIKTQAVHVPSQPISPIPGMEIDLGKLNILAKDKEVTVIECQGPEKFVIVKKAGGVNLTHIKLSQEDINNIIRAFSDKARIPLIDGVFKAIIGELSINAIITNAVCNRFMIYKKSPYSFLDQQ